MNATAAPATQIALGANQYGKARVRVAHVERDGDWHTIRERTVRVALRGAFDAAHVSGDNSAVLPTDTMKNTVHSFAEQAPMGETVERFAERLHRHFGGTSGAVAGVLIEAAEVVWRRLVVDGAEHPHAFERAPERRLARVNGAVDVPPAIWGGIDELSVLKTTGSSFSGFPRDQYTTLPETDDRVLATVVEARWRFGDDEAATVDDPSTWGTVRSALVTAFATHESPSVQATLHRMGEAALTAVPGLREIALTLPNRHYLPLDLTAIGGTRGTALLPIDEPHGLIEATIRRA